MKRIFTMTLIAMALASCGEKIDYGTKDKYEFGEPMGQTLELIEVDGKYAPKADIVSQDMFNRYFYGVWRLKETHYVSTTGQLDTAPMPVDEEKPLFAIKSDGVIRQYIYSKELGKKFYKDGTYSYEPATGVVTINGLIDIPNEFRIILLGDLHMSGTYYDADCLAENYALTHCRYDNLSIDYHTLDFEYTEELPQDLNL